MGLILDSSVLIATERQGKNARQMLTAVAGKIGETDIGISVVTLVELAYGAARADTTERKEKR
jgi:predicted nucleic acid-binding protein